MSVSILIGDCRERMKELADSSVDSVVCDPPYHLTGTGTPLALKLSDPGGGKAYDRSRMASSKRGFMGQTWDGGDIAQDPAMWAEVLRVLKPGGHLVAFSGTRTSHRMVCAIEDAGFEIRDSILDLIASDDPVRQFLASLAPAQIEAFFRCIEDSRFGGLLAWVYGSGFPKSLDVSKAIDRARTEDREPAKRVGEWLRAKREESGLTQREVASLWPSVTGGITGCVGNWEAGRVPTWAEWLMLKARIGFDGQMDEEVWRLNGRKGKPGESWEKRGKKRHVARPETSGTMSGKMDTRPWIEASRERGYHETAGDTPATHAAQQWQGWGTALKPSWEPICLARKPLESTVAANVLKHGTGALNIDACRVEHQSEADRASATPQGRTTAKSGALAGKTQHDRERSEFERPDTSLGRWPANLCHDGSDEVLAGFPAEAGASGKASGPTLTGFSDRNCMAGSFNGVADTPFYGDSGSAARFFYCAKATSEERGKGNGHPTVKPIALMRWLCRLVTPPGGTILDPFSGSGSTLIAADAEQFNAIGCELSPEYAAIAERRVRDAAGMFADVKVAA